VFLGPTLPVAQARQLLDADYLPPARMGDVYALLGSGIGGIVLIDGVFHGQPAVWQRELLAAVDGGVPVLGASSMGALRAAELSGCGMTGCGTIFQWYRDGLLEADDAVALLHGPAELGYPALSTPLVNIMATVRRLEAAGVLDATERAHAELLAARRNYHDRSMEALVADAAAAGWEPGRADVLRSALAALYLDQKAADAMTALEEAARWHDEDRPAARTPAHELPQRWRLGRLLRGSYADGRGDELAARLRQEVELRQRAAAATLLLALPAPAAAGGTASTAAGGNCLGSGPTDMAGRRFSSEQLRAAGLLPGEAVRLERVRIRLSAACGGLPLLEAARRALQAVGVMAPDGAAFGDWLLAAGPAAVGVPYDEDAALIECWQRETLEAAG
jgi:hypothetical protein